MGYPRSLYEDTRGPSSGKAHAYLICCHFSKKFPSLSIPETLSPILAKFGQPRVRFPNASCGLTIAHWNFGPTSGAAWRPAGHPPDSCLFTKQQPATPTPTQLARVMRQVINKVEHRLCG